MPKFKVTVMGSWYGEEDILDQMIVEAQNKKDAEQVAASQFYKSTLLHIFYLVEEIN